MSKPHYFYAKKSKLELLCSNGQGKLWNRINVPARSNGELVTKADPSENNNIYHFVKYIIKM